MKRSSSESRDRRVSLGLGPCPRSVDVAGGEQGGGLSERPSRQSLATLGRRQPVRRGEQLGGGSVCPAPRRPGRRALELGRDRLVRRRHAQREVARTLLLIGDDRRQPLVEPTAPLRRRGAVDDRCEQRMGEADAVALRRQETCLFRLDERRARIDLVAQCVLNRRQRRLRERRDRQCDAMRSVRGDRHPSGYQVLDASRDRQRSVGDTLRHARPHGRSRARRTDCRPRHPRVERAWAVTTRARGARGSRDAAPPTRVEPARRVPDDPRVRPVRDRAARRRRRPSAEPRPGRARPVGAEPRRRAPARMQHRAIGRRRSPRGRHRVRRAPRRRRRARPTSCVR